MNEKTIVDGPDKIKELTYDLQFMPQNTSLESKVKCKICGKEFLYKDSTVVELCDVVGFYMMVKCKFFPVCKGNRQDFEV